MPNLSLNTMLTCHVNVTKPSHNRNEKPIQLFKDKLSRILIYGTFTHW